MIGRNLFGEPPTQAEVRASLRKKPARKAIVRRGYAMPPGTGPAGETCGSCAHIRRAGYTSKVYLKCALMRGRWTKSQGTDVLAGSPACRKWEAET